jgi:biopolymer transport protein ExbB
MSILQTFQAGGFVMYPLLAFSIGGIALIIERIRFWAKILKPQQTFAKEFLQIYEAQPDLAFDKIKRHLELPIARIFAAPFELDEPSPDVFQRALEAEAQAELPTMKRFNNVFEAIIGLSPLMGLLGTVTGLINSFKSLNIGDMGGTKATNVSAGISEALIATATGLVVAAVMLAFFTLFRSLYQRQLNIIEESIGHLELLYRHRHEKQLVARR